MVGQAKELCIETERLRLRRFTDSDAPLILELLTDPLWLRFIGDRKVRTLEDAGEYLGKIIRAHDAHGFGLHCVERKSDGVALGMCGLVKRDSLPDPDLGFAFLERFRGEGYAREAAAGTMTHAREVLGLARIFAIATPDNDRSNRLLAKLGFVCEGPFEGSGSSNDGVDLWSSGPLDPGAS